MIVNDISLVVCYLMFEKAVGIENFQWFLNYFVTGVAGYCILQLVFVLLVLLFGIIIYYNKFKQKIHAEHGSSNLYMKKEGFYNLKGGNFIEAIKCFKRVVEIDPQDTQIRHTLAELHYKNADYEQCLQECGAINKTPRLGDCHLIAKTYILMAGCTAKIRNDPISSDAYFKKAHDVCPTQIIKHLIYKMKQELKLIGIQNTPFPLRWK